MRHGIAYLLVFVIGLLVIGSPSATGQGGETPAPDGSVQVQAGLPAVPDEMQDESAVDHSVQAPNVQSEERGAHPILPAEPDPRMDRGRLPLIEQNPDEMIPGPLRWRERLRAPAPYPPPTFFDPEMGLPGRVRVLMTPGTDRFYLGVSLQPVSDALRSHLRLDPSVGLMVQDVAANSPAVGVLQQYDVLTDVEDQPITQLSDLVQAVQKAGQEQRELKLNLIRTGQRQTVTVKPTQRNEGVLLFRSESTEERAPGEINEWIPVPSPPGFRMLPPLQQPQQAGADWFEQYRHDQDELKKLIEQLRRDVEELRGQIEQPAP
jgi:hypothetical protein